MAWERWITSAILIGCLACYAAAEVRPNPNARAVHDPRVQVSANIRNNIKAPTEVAELVTAENVPYPSYRSSYGGGGYGGGYSPAPPAYYYPMPSYYPPPPPSYGYGYPGSSSYGSYMPAYSYDYYYPPAYPSYGSSYGGSYGGYAPPCK
ncbi:hypothetical protein RvY_13705-2 [Ramazzottius varieornatus]|uniref:Uncharacterized protein n=1 Tax=Ramazzottius varieornatus TaxID=947166 RepID=A0A1D1VNV1_RAMVA|nr:hypothetical protein RvY_13705-2 [Ramazzottius varieornatus]